jgi:hypothetical protein
MAWKIEKWFEEVFPGKENIFKEYSNLPSRELVIVCAAVVDVALAELISLRLRNDNKEIEEFIGANGDGRAPIGSFGAKIQLAYLLNIITKSDAEILRTIKNLRNIFAHRVKVDFKVAIVIKQLKKLSNEWKDLGIKLNPDFKNNTEKLDEIIGLLGEDEDAGVGLLLAIFTVYQAYFHRIREKITRIDNFKNKK